MSSTENILIQLTKDEKIIVNEALLNFLESDANSYYKEVTESILSKIEVEEIE